ncbi:hypothetical protein [Actinocatenispora rupis]|uniref:NHL repeat-containing protein n=1 Tax=Actinocatenispora rupis TaxID=519421 RepID=A0A8J3J924_9ACTN|nr:hypothetical protein [Actinocatenispora rupis]GID11653.1 hypothetical protein Aru02nite_25420 [Actinocatenispora rupis]
MIRQARIAPFAAILVAAAALASPGVAWSAPSAPVLTTVAGTGDGEYSGDGGRATRAGVPVSGPVALAPDGTLYLVSGSRIRAVEPNGTIRTVAGTGRTGWSGDGGAATRASLGRSIGGLAVARDGTLYVADTGNDRVRAVDPHTHRIGTVAGGGRLGDGAPADEARLSDPTDVAVAPDGTLYIADRRDGRIRAVDPDRHTIRTFAGGGTDDPLYHRGGFGGDTGATALRTYLEPVAVAVAPDATVYVADRNRILAVRPGSGAVTVFDGSGADALRHPSHLTVAAHTLYVVDDAGVHTLRLGDPGAALHRYAGGGDPDRLGDGGTPTAVAFGADTDVAAAPGGPVYLSDPRHHRIRAVTAHPPARADPGPARPVTSYPFRDSTFADPTAVAVGTDATAYVADGRRGVVDAVDPRHGTRTRVATGLDHPRDLALHHHTLYVADRRGVRAVDLSTHTTTAVRGAPGAAHLATDPRGTLYVSSRAGVCVLRSGSCRVLATHARVPAAGAITVDTTGTAYVVDGGRVRAVAPTGTVATVAGAASGTGPYSDGGPATSTGALSVAGLAVTGRTLYLADPAGHRIRAVDLARGTITTVPGGTRGLDGPADVAVGPHGALFVADPGAHRLRVVGTAPRPTPAASPGTRWYLVVGPGVVLVAAAAGVLSFRRRRRRPAPDTRVTVRPAAVPGPAPRPTTVSMTVDDAAVPASGARSAGVSMPDGPGRAGRSILAD